MNAKFHNIFIFFFAAILAGIVFITVLSYRSTKDYQSTSQLVSHTHIVLEEADEISSLSKSLQLESAGFYYTNDSSFLSAFTTAKVELLHHLTSIKHLTVDNVSQKERIDSLQILINNLISFSEALIQFRKMNATYNTSTSNNFIQKKLFRERINIDINNIKEEEKRLLLIRQDANDKSQAVASNTFNVLIVLIFLLVTIGFLMTLIHLNRRIKAEEELRKSNVRFDMLVNNIKDFAIFMIDNNGKILDWYSGAKRMKGYTGDEVLGKPISIFYTEEDVKNGIPEHNLQKAAANGSYEEEGWRVKRDGTKFWADVVITAIYSNEGELIGFTKVTRDFTLHKKAADDMRLALEMANELNTMKSNFVSMASHEFRTPLTSILTSAILVEQYKNADEQNKRERHTKKIRTSVATLTYILEEFLSLEKIESGKIQIKVQNFNLKDLATTICEDAKNNAKQGQNILYHHSGKEEVNLDHSFIRHILTNLTSNALKYSPENAYIEIFTSVLNNKVSIRAKDNGIGISAEDQKHLFERFFRASNSGNIQGTGLGLHIIKRYVDMMNGIIAVKSEPGKGSEFIVEVESKVFETTI
jgi:PAS domain S-box-containing protein